MFFGYSEGVEGYRLWCLQSKKSFNNRDVIFDKGQTYGTIMFKNSKSFLNSSKMRVSIEVKLVSVMNDLEDQSNEDAI